MLHEGTRIQINKGVTDDWVKDGEKREIDYSGKLGTIQKDWEDGTFTVQLDDEDATPMIFEADEFARHLTHVCLACRLDASATARQQEENMSREVKRVPLDFDWPLNKVWGGYLMPDGLSDEVQCPDCKGTGESPEAYEITQKWYGYSDFDPAESGREPYTSQTPAVRERAERNVKDAPWYYGSGEIAFQREAKRLADLYNSRLACHLTQEDVDALIADNRLWDFTRRWDSEQRKWVDLDPMPVVTAEQVNQWELRGMGHDSINRWVVVRARCERMGVSTACATCDGHGSTERYPGQREEAEKWEGTEPPTGEGWQLWETISEGSPITRVFATKEELAHSLRHEGDANGQTYAQAYLDQLFEMNWMPTFLVSEKED
jgi:hypothetical protein